MTTHAPKPNSSLYAVRGIVRRRLDRAPLQGRQDRPVADRAVVIEFDLVAVGLPSAP